MKRSSRRAAAVLVPGALVLLAACSGSTTPATSVTATTATLNAKYSCNTSCSGSLSYWPTDHTSEVSTTPTQSVSSGSSTAAVTVNHLLPGTTYAYKICGQGDGGSSACADSKGTSGGTSYTTFTTKIGLGFEAAEASHPLTETNALATYESETGRAVDIRDFNVLWAPCQDQTKYPGCTDAYFPAGNATDSWNAGHQVEITWDLQDESLSGTTDPALRTSTIYNGSWDSYITTFANAMKSFGHPIYLRFSQEMNANYALYNDGVNGNSAGDYVKAWKYLHDKFVALGATNVRWVWSPAVVPGDTVSTLQQYFPGDSYVDVVGYTYYQDPTQRDASGSPVASVCTNDPSTLPALYAKLAALSAKPWAVTEFGIGAKCTDSSGNPSRPALMTAVFNWAKAQPKLQWLTYWDYSALPNDDWRLAGDTASINALRAGIASIS